MTIELNGASKANLEDLANDDAEVELNGASSITLAPKLSSDIEINRVGKARVLSRPASSRLTPYSLIASYPKNWFLCEGCGVGP